MSVETLLKTAKDAEYFTMSLEMLEDYYEASAQFIATGRLTVMEADWVQLVEQHFYLSLLTCHDNEAKLALQRLEDKFGTESQRVLMHRAAYVQSTQDPEAYKEFRANLPEEIDQSVLVKRELAEIKSTNKWADYIEKLVPYLDMYPSDLEAWSELAEAYASSGNYDSAVRSLTRVLVMAPFAFQIFARIGELRHIEATAMLKGIDGSMEQLVESVANFSRSVELCPSYIRGWSGIYVVTSKLVQWPKTPQKSLYEELNTKARDQLESLIAENVGRPEDLAAAKKILI